MPHKYNAFFCKRERPAKLNADKSPLSVCKDLIFI